MKYITPVLLFALIISCNSLKKENIQIMNYPETKKVDTVDIYFGTEVSDPYRWLEDDNSTETTEWVKAQNKITFSYLDSIPFRDKIRSRLEEVWNYEKIFSPTKKGDYYFYFKNNGLQNQNVLYYTKNLYAEPKVLIDPNTLSDDGTVSLGVLAISKDGKYIAYSISRGGSDWREIYVKNVETKENLEDHIKWAKFTSIAWYKDGLFYSRYNEPKKGDELSDKNEYHKVYYHKIGTQQSEDRLCYENKEKPMRNYYAEVTYNQEYLVIYETESTSGNSLFVKKLDNEKNMFVKLAEGFEYDYGFIYADNNNIYILTNDNAPRYKIVRIDIDNPAKENWEEVIPEKEYVLETCNIASGKFIVKYMKDVHNVLEVYDLQGNFLHETELPGIGSVNNFEGEADQDTAFYAFTSFTMPATFYKYHVDSNTSELFYKPNVKFNFDDYITEQIFYKSKDGTKIPMFIVHKKGIALDGSNHTLLYGYGGFNFSQTPYFSISRSVWLETGGVFALANIRGGGEYGEEWHKAGTKFNKQNVFDDFIAAAEYLIENKYTSPEKLAVQGGSNGGLLIGAVVNQRPELFKVALPEVGVMDMLRYHKFTIGWAWASDYGTSNDSTDFSNLYKYSPLHNIKENTGYPATLVITADHDDRVVPAHSFKYAATLQEKYKGKNPVLIRVETSAGHGAGTPTSKKIDELADKWAFILFNMGTEPFQ